MRLWEKQLGGAEDFTMITELHNDNVDRNMLTFQRAQKNEFLQIKDFYWNLIDEMALVMLINKIQTPEDYEAFRNVSEELINSIYGNAPKEIKEIYRRKRNVQTRQRY